MVQRKWYRGLAGDKKGGTRARDCKDGELDKARVLGMLSVRILLLKDGQTNLGE